MRNIRVVPHDPSWIAEFEQEAGWLAAVFGDLLLSIHHIGSTSVPDLPAKPVIDIMPVVHDINGVERHHEALAALGYEARGENGIPGRRYFTKGGQVNRRCNVHTYEPDHPEVKQHLDFRDYLRTHPEIATAYGRLKASLAQQFPDDIFGYMAAKDRFIKETMAKARVWRATLA